MPRNNAKTTLYRHVSYLRDQLHVTLASYPLHLADLYFQHPIDVKRHAFQTSGFCALAFIGKQADTIVLNANRTPLEQNFDYGHELIHLTKHRNLKLGCFNCFDKTQPTQNPFIEWEANEGAAELLVPYQLFLPALRDTSQVYCREPQKIKPALADQFQVTSSVIEYRIQSLKYELYQYIVLGTDISQITLLSRHEAKQQHLSHLSAFSYYCPKCLSPINASTTDCCPYCDNLFQQNALLYGLGYQSNRRTSSNRIAISG